MVRTKLEGGAFEWLCSLSDLIDSISIRRADKGGCYLQGPRVSQTHASLMVLCVDQIQMALLS